MLDSIGNRMTAPTEQTADNETCHWRPRYHFTPERNWINDPNGLVFHEGEYHLFYQYNPKGKDWGHMSWGHAVSTDLLNWEELPVAIPEREFMIFSGCAVVDHANTSGLGSDGKAPLVAIYTAHFEGRDRQMQHLAYSLDRGRSWIDHPANPVIDRNMAHFRDPKVFWHAESAAWVLVVALAQEHKVLIYRSSNLIDWQFASEFGPSGNTNGQWECPDLLPLPVEGGTGEVWMLKIDVDKNFIGSVNGAQVFFGAFDGFTFTSIDDAGQPGDVGADFYAAQSWSDLPDDQGHPVWIGWMSNHQSGHEYPTHPWRGAMTMPRQLCARARGKGWALIQRPVASWDALMASSPSRQLSVGDNESVTLAPTLEEMTGEVRLRCATQSRAVFSVGAGADPTLRVVVNGPRRSIAIERYAHVWEAPQVFEEPMHAEWTDGNPEIRILFDRQSVEVFVPEEGISMTGSFFAEPDAALTVSAHGEAADVGVFAFPLLR